MTKPDDAQVPTCAYCGKQLPHFPNQLERESPSDRGYDGNGIFCTLRCGYKYGLMVVKQINERKRP